MLLDVLGRRPPNWPQASRVWTLAETGSIQAYISAISYNNTYYIVRRWGGRKRAESSLRLLRDVFETVDLTQKILIQAMDSELSDFEDSIQYFSAIHTNASFIITRNTEDFPKVGPIVMSPGEWLATLSE